MSLRSLNVIRLSLQSSSPQQEIRVLADLPRGGHPDEGAKGHPEFKERIPGHEALKEGLGFSAMRGLMGHGYDANTEMREAVGIPETGQADRYLEEELGACPVLRRVLAHHKSAASCPIPQRHQRSFPTPPQKLTYVPIIAGSAINCDALASMIQDPPRQGLDGKSSYAIHRDAGGGNGDEMPEMWN
jgi:hypothetical protein